MFSSILSFELKVINFHLTYSDILRFTNFITFHEDVSYNNFMTSVICILSLKTILRLMHCIVICTYIDGYTAKLVILGNNENSYVI